MIRLVLFFCFWAVSGAADVLVAARTIPAHTILTPDDLLIRDVTVAGGMTDPSEAVGKEARVALFAGRPIRASDLSAPAVVDRNEVIALIYDGSGLYIKTEGRALDRASAGEVIRVMNLQSRTTVTARIDESGTAYVAR